MPKAEDHLKWAGRHAATAAFLAKENDHRSWAAVAMFYAARDLVHAVLASDPQLADERFRHPTNHSSTDHNDPGTNFVVKRHYGAVERSYMLLYATSQGVRYQGQVVDTRRIQALTEKLGDVKRWAAMWLVVASIPPPSWLTAGK